MFDGARRIGLLDKTLDTDHASVILARRDNAVGAGLVGRHIHHRHHVAALIGLDHLGNAWCRDKVVGKKDEDRFVADKVARAPDGMAKPGGLLLAHIPDRAGLCRSPRELQCAGLALRPKCRLELEGMIEMVLDRRLVLAGDKDELFNPAVASSTAYWISGLSTTGSISFGIAFVAGRKRVPSPPTGKMAFLIIWVSLKCHLLGDNHG